MFARWGRFVYRWRWAILVVSVVLLGGYLADQDMPAGRPYDLRFLQEELLVTVADGWEPLLAIADLAGGDWPEAARNAAKALSGAGGVESHSIRIELLAAIKRVFAKLNVDRISSKALIAELVNDEDGPWTAYGKSGKPITPRQIAHLLSGMTIPAHDASHRLHWSRWRRRHQHRARTCHYRRQAAQDQET